MPAIQVTDLRKSFGDNAVLRGVTFEVQRGEVFALLGSNGAGKTTTINILSTLLQADSPGSPRVPAAQRGDSRGGGGGQAVLAGHDVAADPAAVRRSISLTGQFAAVDEILTGRENLELIATLRREAAPKQVATDLLARFGLTDAADRRAGTYSGGMKRRLDIAMSLVGKPEIIFLDEPTTGLDPEGRLEVWKTVKELATNGTTILLTTQYLDEAEALADRIAILHGGTIIANGTLAELKAMFPPAKVEYVEKQPSLEDIFLAITGSPAVAPGSPAVAPVETTSATTTPKEA